MYAYQGDPVKAVDLFGLVDRSIPCVIELKMYRESGQDTPLYALLEALTYCSVVQANGANIAREVGFSTEVGMRWTSHPPMLVVMAPRRYWTSYKKKRAADGWFDAIDRLIVSLKDALDVDAHLIALDAAEFDMGWIKGDRDSQAPAAACPSIKSFLVAAAPNVDDLRRLCGLLDRWLLGLF